MRFRRLIATVIALLAILNLASADQSASYKIDLSRINSGGSVMNSTNYTIHDTFTGTLDGKAGESANFKTGSGLVYLEQWCGNGILEITEGCDDGNNTAGDDCSAACVIEPAPVSVCGNGAVETGESCDDGNLISGDGCSSSCQTETQQGGGGGSSQNAFCGNKIKQGTEQCDDGNKISGDGCSAACILEPGKWPVIPPLTDAEKKAIAEAEAKAAAAAKAIADAEAAAKAEAEAEITGETRTIKIKAFPEDRVNAAVNHGIAGWIKFYNKTLKKTVLILDITINNNGWGQITSDRLPEGIYDISFKGSSHLTSVIRNININSTAETINFTPIISEYLIAGDVHKSKDDLVNGLDISEAINELYTNNINADMNRDGIVNGLDLAIIISNLYKTGERLIQ